MMKHFTVGLLGLLAVDLPVSHSEVSLDQPFTSSFSQLVHAPCVSLFHRNGRVGCGTDDHSVEIGHLMYYKGQLPDGSESSSDYVMLVEDYDLTADTLGILLKAKGGPLKGILVLNSTNANSNSQQSSSSSNTIPSPDSKYPQGYGTPSENVNYGYSNYPWNSKGENLFSYNLFGLPMVYVPNADVAESLRQESANGDSTIVAEFNYYMGPEIMTSAQCLAWKDLDDEWSPKCLPLGGTSVWASAGSPPNPNKQGRSRQLGSNRPVVMLAAGMDATSMFHDLTPGASTAASSILTLLMAAKLLGSSVSDYDLDNLPNRIVFALFQGEAYGFVGSRAFFRDIAYPGFQCKSTPVKSTMKAAKSGSSSSSEYACLNPLRPSLKFADLGQIAGMLSVDQVGHAMANGILYVHADENNNSYGAYLANLLKYSSTNSVSVAASSAADNGNGYPYPPSPLTSLLQLSGGTVGGAVLTGYDYSFTGKIPYHSQADSASAGTIELDTIAAAATIVARTALAAAFDDGTYGGQGDYSTPTAYAKNLIPQLSSDDQTLLELYNCLFFDGQCDLIKKHSKMEAENDKAQTGVSVGTGSAFGTPPNYYVGVYNAYNGQPYVQVGDKQYGAYNGDDYGKKTTDAITMQPTELERSLHGLMNHFLGQGSARNGGVSLQSCKKPSDCSSVGYCVSYGDSAVCSGGGICVCKRAHYHVALDEALVAAENKLPGYFVANDDSDAGISPVYAEPFWSSSVGVRVYRDAGQAPGLLTLAAGLAVGAASLFGVFVLKVGLKKEKLY